MTSEEPPHDAQPDESEKPTIPRPSAESKSDVRLTWASAPGSAGAARSVPRKLGSIRLIDEIGRGGMGVVFRGWDETLRRPVAVKFLLGAVAGARDPHFEQFLAGARAEAALRHANIVAVHSAGVIDGVPYLVMDYIDGPSLGALCRSGGGLGLAAVSRVMWDVAAAVTALHEAGFVHRDLKSANVLLDRDGRVYVTDFGLAALRQKTDPNRTAAGTPAYMAPEAFEGVALPQTDVYAMGVLFFELLAGHTPFGGDFEALRGQHAEAALPMDALGSDLPEAVAELIERAAHKKDVFRYKTAGHFQRALRDAGANESLLRAGQVELENRVGRWLSDEAGTHASSAMQKTPASSVQERVAQLAAEKRKARLESTANEENTVATGTGMGGDVVVGSVGAASVKAIDAMPGLLDESGLVVADLACRRCGYNLRALHVQGRCPECAAAIGLAVHGDLLRFADPGWVNTLSRGGTCIMAALVAMFGGLGVMICAGLTLAAGVSAGMPVVVMGLVTAVVGLWFVGAIGLLIYGAWLVTAPDPSRVGEDRYAMSRKIVRLCVAIGAAYLPLSALKNALGSLGPEAALLEIAAGVAALAFLIGFITYFRYVGKLAGRIPDVRLARRARVLFVGWLVVLAMQITLATAPKLMITLGSSAFKPYTAMSRPSSTVSFHVESIGGQKYVPVGVMRPIVAVKGVLVVLMTLVFAVMFVAWQAGVSKAFREQAEIARKTWAADRGPPGAAV